MKKNLIIKLWVFVTIYFALLGTLQLKAGNCEEHFEVDECIIGNDEINQDHTAIIEPSVKQKDIAMEDTNKANQVNQDQNIEKTNKSEIDAQKSKSVQKVEQVNSSQADDIRNTKNDKDDKDDKETIKHNNPMNFTVPHHNMDTGSITGISNNTISINSDGNMVNDLNITSKKEKDGLEITGRENNKYSKASNNLWYLLLVMASIIFLVGFSRLLYRLWIHYGKLKDAML